MLFRSKKLKTRLAAIKDVTIGELMEAKVLDIEDQAGKLNTIFGGSDIWKTYSVDNFIKKMIERYDAILGGSYS